MIVAAIKPPTTFEKIVKINDLLPRIRYIPPPFVVKIRISVKIRVIIATILVLRKAFFFFEEAIDAVAVPEKAL